MFTPVKSVMVSKVDIENTASLVVDKLIKKGYLERKRSETDRRIVNVSLTKRGKLAYRIHEKFHLDMVKAIMLDFTPEEEEVLLTALSKLNKHLKDIYSGSNVIKTMTDKSLVKYLSDKVLFRSLFLDGSSC